MHISGCFGLTISELILSLCRMASKACPIASDLARLSANSSSIIWRHSPGSILDVLEWSLELKSRVENSMKEEGESGAVCTEEGAMSESLSSILYPAMVG